MTGITGRTFLASTAIFLVLSACEDGGDLFGSTTSRDDATAGAVDASPAAEARTETREVERPDVFSVTESGLWDGRPSLGGIWVAHPDVVDPDRVRIENTANGRVINGALFRRERENPGPRIQVSSDAAEELGILAGEPATLSLVVVREEEVVIEPIIVPPSEADALEPETETATLEAATVDDLAAGEVETADAGAPLEAPVRTPRRQGFFATLFGTGASQTEPVQTEVITENGDVVTTTTAAAPDVETASLDTIAVASAAIDEAEAAGANPAPARPAPSGGLRNPYVQVGLFSVEENAEAAAASLRQNGIVPEIVAGSNGDRQFWRVLVGPMTNADEQATMLNQVRDLGYSDAFLAPS